MNSFDKDPRFSKVLTDPRFLPMPTYEKKVKIDKRFNALFTSKDFGHRTLRDKRGRPIHDVSKRSKHLMEQYYDVSSDESTSSETESGSDNNDKSESSVDGEKKRNTKSKKVKVKEAQEKVTSLQQKTSKKRKMDNSNSHQNETELSRKKKKVLQNEDGVVKEDKPTSKKTKRKERKKDSTGEEEDAETKPGLSEKGRKKITTSKKKKESIKSDESDKEEEDMEEEEEEHSEEESSADESSSDDDENEMVEYTTEYDLEETAVEHKWNELHKDAPSVTESSHRLAVCNMDWDFVKAQDLYVLFNSFAGEGESVRSVVIYPSDFGKERMKEEAALGPKEMRENLKKEEEMKKKFEQKKKKKNKLMDGQIVKRMEKQIVNAEREVLRNYQLNRLRYYYAVVDCSSVEAADNIYKECDGQEYQLSGVCLDLRFIPDDMSFDETPKESFSEEQGLVDYTPQLFSSSALSQAKVEVTWDETEFDRLQKRMLTVLHKEMEDIVEENRYADIIAPPESDSDFEDGEDGRPEWLKKVLANQDDDDEDNDLDQISEEKKIELYRKVLMDKLVEEDEKEKKENEVDKEMSWQPGLKAAVQEKLKKTEKAHGTVVDEFLEKKKEKKRKKREKKKAELGKSDESDEEKQEEEEEMPDIIDNSLKEMMKSEGVDVDSLKDKKNEKKDKKRTKKIDEEENSEDERGKAELELLLMDDGEEKSVTKPEKIEGGKLSRRQKKKRAMLEKEMKKQAKDELTIDVDDQRFGAMFTSHHFHIDPNAPEFKKTKNMMKLVDEQIKRKSKSDHKTNSRNKNRFIESGEGNEESDSRTVSKNLVESLKRKMKKR